MSDIFFLLSALNFVVSSGDYSIKNLNSNSMFQAYSLDGEDPSSNAHLRPECFSQIAGNASVASIDY